VGLHTCEISFKNFQKNFIDTVNKIAELLIPLTDHPSELLKIEKEFNCKITISSSEEGSLISPGSLLSGNHYDDERGWNYHNAYSTPKGNVFTDKTGRRFY